MQTQDDSNLPGQVGAGAFEDTGSHAAGPGGLGATGVASGSVATSSPQARIHRLAEGAHAAVDRTVERAQPAVERMERELEAARGRLDAALDSGRGIVREHPAMSIATAFLVGVLLGQLRSR